MRHVFYTILILICGIALIGCKDRTDSAKVIPKTEPNETGPSTAEIMRYHHQNAQLSQNPILLIYRELLCTRT